MALLGSWHFNENDTANVRDYSTKGLDSTSVSGLTIVASDRGLAGKFLPATPTLVNFGDVASPGTGKITINFKIKFADVSSDQVIIDKDGEFRVELQGSSSLLIFSIWVGAVKKELVTNTAIVVDTFTRIQCINDGTDSKIIINGTEDAIGAIGTIDSGSNDLLLGHLAGAPTTKNLDALIEVIEIRDTDLTTDDITTLDLNMGGMETTFLTKHSFSEGDLLEWVSDIVGLSNSRVVCTLNKDATTVLLIVISGLFVPGLRYRRRGNVFDTTRQWLAEIKEVAGKPYIFFSNEIKAFGSDTPDASSVLDFSQVNDRGALFPSLTTTERDAIASPATGLFIFNETTNQHELFVSGSWGSAGSPTSPGGSDKQIQFNDVGAFGGDANFTWDKGAQKLLVKGKMLLGINGTVITHIQHGSVSIDPPSIPGKSEVTITKGITGLASTDRIFMTPPNDFEDQLIFKGARIVTPNTVTLTIANYDTGPVNGTAKDWHFLAIRP